MNRSAMKIMIPNNNANSNDSKINEFVISLLFIYSLNHTF